MGDTACGDQQSSLLDVSRLSLADVRTLDDTAIAHSLRRLLEEVDEPRDAVAGWQSAI